VCGWSLGVEKSRERKRKNLGFKKKERKPILFFLFFCIPFQSVRHFLLLLSCKRKRANSQQPSHLLMKPHKSSDNMKKETERELQMEMGKERRTMNEVAI